jgi:hypothetical protein
MRAFILRLSLLSLLLSGCELEPEADAGAPPASPWRANSYDASYGKHWYDGKAELAAYTLTYPRYGAERPNGTAVAITVTEDMRAATRVKANDNGPDTVPVLKLNLVEDFATGIYDYNMMTSAFVQTRAGLGLPAGAQLKVSFSSQEWCGHAYQQALFNPDKIHHTAHSYFEGEADTDAQLDGDAGGLSEDVLYLWARGLAGPALAPGEAVKELPLWRSAAVSRLRHIAPVWDRATLTRAAKTESITSPAGTFEVDRYEASVTRTGAANDVWTFLVEHAAPHRVIVYARADGLRAELVGSKRLPYWQLHDRGQEALLKEIGLTPRGPRTP